MTAADTAIVRAARRRLPIEMFGGWEVGLIIFMILLYLVGVYINPRFFGGAEALSSVLRDAARYGVMAVGMTFVIVNKDLDLSVGSLYGVTAVVFSVAFSQSYFDAGIVAAVGWSIFVGLTIGLINGTLVTVLRVPAFIATLTMLFIGRGFVTGLSGGKTISYIDKAKGFHAFFVIGENNSWGFNNQIFVFILFAVVGAYLLAKTRAGYQTFATGGNELAATYAGITDELGAHARLSDVGLLRHHRRADAGGAGSRHDRPVRPGAGADRHRLGDRRRRFDPGRARPHPRLRASA